MPCRLAKQASCRCSVRIGPARVVETLWLDVRSTPAAPSKDTLCVFPPIFEQAFAYEGWTMTVMPEGSCLGPRYSTYPLSLPPSTWDPAPATFQVAGMPASLNGNASRRFDRYRTRAAISLSCAG